MYEHFVSVFAWFVLGKKLHDLAPLLLCPAGLYSIVVLACLACTRLHMLFGTFIGIKIPY